MQKKTGMAVWAALLVALSGTSGVFAGENDEMIQLLNKLNGTSSVPAGDKDEQITPLQNDRSETPVVPVGDKDEQITQLQSELKGARRQINKLEEELFIATDGQQLDEEEAVGELAQGIYPWTEYARRTPIGILSPKTHTIPKGTVYGRFSHISQNQSFAGNGDPFDDMLGLESGVKVGIMFGYGITDNWDVTLQRTNGRGFGDSGAPDYDSWSFDLWDIMTKVQVLHEDDQFVDLSLTGGGTYYWQNNGETGKWSTNAGVLLEKSVWRFRLGTGLLYSSLSNYERTFSSQDETADDKPYPNNTYGIPLEEEHTTAIPANISFALTPSLSLFGEAAFPVGGYETDKGPSAAAGFRIVTHSHAYSLFFSNTSNNSFNSTITGGYKQDRLDVFGFDISIFFN